MKNFDDLLAFLRSEFPEREFYCEKIMGLRVPGWSVCSAGKTAFISQKTLPNPALVRERIEKAFGLFKKRERTQDEAVVRKARISATSKRTFRNRIASGQDVTMPWHRPRTLNTIVAEERTLAITQKWQRLGEYRR